MYLSWTDPARQVGCSLPWLTSESREASFSAQAEKIDSAANVQMDPKKMNIDSPAALEMFNQNEGPICAN